MIESFAELKETFGLKTILVKWNQDFPIEGIREIYKDTKGFLSLFHFLDYLENTYSNLKVNTRDFYIIGKIAESYDIMISYLITGNNDIELLIRKGTNTKEWLDLFKEGGVARKAFFALVHSFNCLHKYITPFTDSTFYNLYSPHLLTSCVKVNTYILNREYILVQYLNDYAMPEYRVIKPGKVFQEWVPEIVYTPSKFNCITITVDGEVFVGNQIKNLWNKEPDIVDEIKIEYNQAIFTFCPRNGSYFYKDLVDGYVSDIEYVRRYKNDPYINQIFSMDVNGKRVVLLSNGLVWIIPDNKMVDLRSFGDLHDLNIDLFRLSSEEKGIMVSLTNTTIECVPTDTFKRILICLLFGNKRIER